jgi:hypothetical protein
LGVNNLIKKKELIEKIEITDLERIQGDKNVFGKYIYLDNDLVLIVGYEEEEISEVQNPEDETVKNYYWFWELRDSDRWDILFENHDKIFSFCESEMGTYSDQDSIGDVVGDINESEVCKWEDQDWIEDISDDIASKVMEWLTTLRKKIA